MNTSHSIINDYFGNVGRWPSTTNTNMCGSSTVLSWLAKRILHQSSPSGQPKTSTELSDWIELGDIFQFSSLLCYLVSILNLRLKGSYHTSAYLYYYVYSCYVMLHSFRGFPGLKLYNVIVIILHIRRLHILSHMVKIFVIYLLVYYLTKIIKIFVNIICFAISVMNLLWHLNNSVCAQLISNLSLLMGHYNLLKENYFIKSNLFYTYSTKQTISRSLFPLWIFSSKIELFFRLNKSIYKDSFYRNGQLYYFVENVFKTCIKCQVYISCREIFITLNYNTFLIYNIMKETAIVRDGMGVGIYTYGTNQSCSLLLCAFITDIINCCFYLSHQYFLYSRLIYTLKNIFYG